MHIGHGAEDPAALVQVRLEKQQRGPLHRRAPTQPRKRTPSFRRRWTSTQDPCRERRPRPPGIAAPRRAGATTTHRRRTLRSARRSRSARPTTGCRPAPRSRQAPECSPQSRWVAARDKWAAATATKVFTIKGNPPHLGMLIGHTVTHRWSPFQMRQEHARSHRATLHRDLLCPAVRSSRASPAPGPIPNLPDNSAIQCAFRQNHPRARPRHAPRPSSGVSRNIGKGAGG